MKPYRFCSFSHSELAEFSAGTVTVCFGVFDSSAPVVV